MDGRAGNKGGEKAFPWVYGVTKEREEGKSKAYLE